MRVFTAIEFSDDVKSKLSDYIGICRDHVISARFIPAQNIHLTLHFIGEIQKTAIPTIISAMEEAFSSMRHFNIRCIEPGYFKRSEILWIGLYPTDRLAILYNSENKALSKRGFQLETRRYSPHITIARKYKDTVKNLLPFETIEIPVETITLFETVFTAKGPIYHPVYRYHLL